jgi:archaellum component FlaG (FlaF/FlaG flagellin family)
VHQRKPLPACLLNQIQNNVIVFDPTKQHAVMAEANHPYLLYVLNVRKVKHDSKN